MFDRVQRAAAIERRVEQVGHDHVVASVIGDDEAPGIGNGDRRPFLLGRGVVEPGQQRDDFGREFDRAHVEIRHLRCAEHGRAGADTEEEGLARRWMQEQRQHGLAEIGSDRTGAAHAEVAVHLEIACS
jgi:hypothetical protein